MPIFQYIVKTKDSKTIKGSEEAGSQIEIVAKLRSRGFFIVSVKESKVAAKSSNSASYIKRNRKKASVKLNDLTFFARNLSTTLSSGVTLLRSLEIISMQTGSLGLEKVLRNCFKEIKNGLSFGESIAKFPKIFDSLWVGIIRVGETSGNLPFVLERLADYLEMKMEFDRKIKSAMIYPAIMMIAAFLAIIIFLKFIFPQFSGLFEQFNIELPPITQFLFDISNILQEKFSLVLLLCGLFFVMFMYLKSLPETKRVWDRISIKMPILGNLLYLIYLERIASTIHILLDGGLPLVYTLEVTSQCVGSTLFEEKLVAVEQKVRDGNTLSEEFSKQGIFPILVAEMAKIGEETGCMPSVFEKVSIYYRKELTTKVERLVAAFEPLMIIVMGFIIGGIVVSLFLPIFKISSM
ncbi:MAG: type II secretion system F family protein [Candidatus Omnitrophica bacterium]|nr:type II secretion system F family protein [Candidatus Omnitrophota bacterium]MCK5288386.1 type II secretion system F family protein [Candidatus Omnitrophota bacterium]